MKTLIVGCLTLSLGLVVALPSESSEYHAQRSTIDAGGSTFSRSGAYVAGASAGQTAIGQVAGGSHRATLGFWDGGSPPVSTTVPEFKGQAPVVFHFALDPSAPNPFRGSTAIRYEIATRGWVTLIVFDVRGRIIHTLADAEHGAGRYVVTWDGRDARGRQEPPGIYFYRISAPGFTEVRKAVRLE